MLKSICERMLACHIFYKYLLIKICVYITHVSSQASPYLYVNRQNNTDKAITIGDTVSLQNFEGIFNNTKVDSNVVHSLKKNKESSSKKLTKLRNKNLKKKYSNENVLFDFDDTFYDDSDESYYDSDSAYDKPSVIGQSINIAKSKYNSKLDEDSDIENTYFRESYSSEKGIEPVSGFEGFFHTVYDPVQNLIKSVFEDRDDKHSTEQVHHNDNGNQEHYIDEQPSVLNGWFDSWFGFNRQNKKFSSPTKPTPEEEGDQESYNWFNSWFGLKEENDNYNKWFTNWFGTVPEPKRNTTNMPTVVFPQLPFVILTPHTNSQSLIGFLSNQDSTMPLERIKVTNTSSKVKHKLFYNKYQIWHLRPETQAQVRILEDYKQNDFNKKINWLRGPSLRGCTDVLISPTMFENFKDFLISESISYEIKVFDVGKVISYEKHRDQNNVKNILQLKTQPLQIMPWEKYYDYDDILKYLDSVRSRYSRNVELIHIGRSYEGRPLIIVKISAEDSLKNTSNGMNYKTLKLKKTREDTNSVFIEAGTNGREWIGPAAASWIINELLKIMKKKNTTNVEYQYIRNTTWYIMPVLNPDGYVYTHDYDRFWPKTRSLQETQDGFFQTALTWLQQNIINKTSSKYCFGVDLDKNWPYLWDGKSSSPCNAFFAGTNPLSEPETKTLSEFIMEYRKNIKLFVSLQAYGQVVKYPYKKNASNADAMEDVLDVANQGVNGLRKSGSKTRYRVDFLNEFIEKRTGSSDAFALYKAGIPFAYTIYLADNGVHGLLLPSSLIEITSRDAFQIIISMFSYIYEL